MLVGEGGQCVGVGVVWVWEWVTFRSDWFEAPLSYVWCDDDMDLVAFWLQGCGVGCMIEHEIDNMRI